ncbi:MAG: patatin-like phospholipase family protein [Deltaproteobacteria bacterium]|nr:patatin-like phospholipase family protein [Deltaproteobacteria bacterium]
MNPIFQSSKAMSRGARWFFTLSAGRCGRMIEKPLPPGKGAILPIVFLLLLTLAAGLGEAAETASPRPRIGLVLSGGGARGAAHIGVLKVLEELRIPVDVITGTSMGAIVGGFYAAGHSPAEIETLVNSLEWNEAFRDRPPLEDYSFRRKEDIANYMIKFDAGIRDGKLALPRGIIQGENLNFILKSRLIHTATVTDFDRLRIPFRAVAADIVTGETVVLGAGDLAEAIRASMSIPGVFAPVEWEGRLLVDGGIADNLPVDVARSMGADIVVAVNIGTLRRPKEKLTSAMAITAQVMTILIQKNTDAQIASLREGDLLIQPALGEIGSSDFAMAPEAIQIGEEEVRRAIPHLSRLSLPPSGYEHWLAAQRRQPAPLPVIDSVTVDNNSPIAEGVVRAQIRTKSGEPLNLGTLEGDLQRIYSIDTFEKTDFRLSEKDGKTDLRISTQEKSWGPHYLRFGLSLVDNLDGDAGYNVSASLTSTALNRLGAEWQNQIQIGDTPRFFSEFYQPLDESLRYFIAPRVEYKSWNINNYSEGVLLAQFRASAVEAGLDIGRQFENWGQFRLGVRRGYGNVRVRVGTPEPEAKFNSGGLFTSFSYNRLDNFNFPRRGTAVDVVWMIPRTELGSDYSGNGLVVDWLTAKTIARHTVLAGLTVQSALWSEAPLQNSYPLGGFLNLSGYATDELYGQHTGLARLIYYYRLAGAGLGEFHMPLYAGFSLEAGNAWATRGDISGRTLIYAGSLLAGAETYLGPIYLAYGQAEGGRHSLYLFLGHKF